MNTNRTSLRKPGMAQLAWIVVFVALAVVCVAVGYYWWLVLSDSSGVFTITFSTADLDLDGDLDVLVHNRRNPGEFEVFAGGTLWINQGGLQGGQLGQLLYQRNDIEGGLASTIAELDGDGEPDVLVYDGSRLILGLNQGERLWTEAGFFTKSALISAPAGQAGKFGQASQYAALAVGDVDNNGRIDALVLGCCGRAFKVSDENPDIPNFSWIWFNTMDVGGRVAGDVASLEILDGLPVGEAVLSDLDSDGDLDLLVLNLKTVAAMVLLNDGAGHFSDSGQRLDGAGSMALGDLDNDGDPDVMLGNERGAGVWINQGGLQGGLSGKFAASDEAISGSAVRSLVLADLDGDGDLDALAAGKRRAVLWWNAGQGQFTRSAQSFPCSDRQNLTTGDFNGDGWMDIFIAQYDKTAQLWFNNGRGGFSAKSP